MWAKQMNNKNPQTLSLLYPTVKKEINNSMNMILVNESIYIPYTS